ncbi:MAG: 30S ribosomal protein S21 [Gemmatimonadales bacterium]|jgi:small subunit ribosomal protein S21
MTKIVVDEYGSLEGALKVFRRKVQRSGVLKDLRQKRFYVKPSTARRKKAEAARRRQRRSSRRGRK